MVYFHTFLHISQRKISSNKFCATEMNQSSRSVESTTNQNLILWIVYINVVLYATCFQIQRPLEPFLVDKLITSNGNADSAQEYAKLQSFFSLIQTFGSLISGRMLDKFGVKGGFYVNFLACALCYGLLSQATTLNILYLSKIPTIFQMGFLCAQVAAAQVTTDGPERVKALGRLTMSYTVGSVLGPTLGGYLGASGDYYFGAKLAVVGSLISLVLTMFLPNNFHEIKKIEDENDSEQQNVPSTTVSPSFWSVITIVWLFLSTKTITSVANAMATSAFPIVLKDKYEVDEKGLGLIFSISSAFNAVVSGFLLEPMTIWLGGDLTVVIFNCLLAMTLFSAVQGLVSIDSVAAASAGHGLYNFVGVSYIINIFQYTLATTITSESTTKVGPKAKGTLLGLEHSLFAAARVVAPQLGVLLLQSYGISSVCAACAIIFGGVSILWKFYSPSLSSDMCISDKKSERKEK